MAVYGLSAAGFTIPTLQAIRADINAALQAVFGASIDLGDRSIFGQLVGILSERYAVLWELAEAVNSSQSPDTATGAALEAICALTGTFRPAATHGTVTLTLTGTPTTLVPLGSGAKTTSTLKSVITVANATIAATTAWTSSTSYVTSDRVTNSGKVYLCTTSGTSAGSGGPTTTATSISDGTTLWDYLGAGTGDIDVNAQCVDTGAITGISRDVATITTPVAGWSNVINIDAIRTGRDIGTDSELRMLRSLELSGAGETPRDAILAKILQIADVTTAVVFCNLNDYPDADGMPPHSVEAMVTGGADQDILNVMIANVAAGIVTTGNVSGVATDSEGASQLVYFSRVVEVPIFVAITILKDTDYPVDGDAQVKQAIVDWGLAQQAGRDARSFQIGAQAFGVPGVIDVTACLIDDAAGPTVSTTIPISLRQRGTYSVGNIQVTSSSGIA